LPKVACPAGPAQRVLLDSWLPAEGRLGLPAAAGRLIVPSPHLFCKSVIRWDFKSNDFVRVDSKGLTGALFVRVSSKGLSKLAIDSKGVICCKLGQFSAFFVRVSSKGLSKLAFDSTGVICREFGQLSALLVRVSSKGLSKLAIDFEGVIPRAERRTPRMARGRRKAGTRLRVEEKAALWRLIASNTTQYSRNGYVCQQLFI
jgi:hypothetical protein